MTNLIENPVYESGIFQLETTTPVLGGPVGFNLGVPTTGFSNAQAQQLANRTAYLKDRVDVDLAGSGTGDGSDMVGYPDALAPAFLKTTSDILNGLPVQLNRFIDRSKHASIRAGTNTDDLFDNVQSALDSGASKIIVGQGIYNFESDIALAKALQLRPKMSISGYGVNSILKNMGDNTALVFLGDASGDSARATYPGSATRMQSVTFSDFVCEGNTLSLDGFNLQFTEKFGRGSPKFNNVIVRNHGQDGIYWSNGDGLMFQGCDLLFNGRHNLHVFGFANTLEYFGGSITGAKNGEGAYVNQVASSCSFWGVQMHDNAGSAITAQRCEQVAMTGCGMNGNGYILTRPAVRLLGDSGKYTESASFKGLLLGDNNPTGADILMNFTKSARFEETYVYATNSAKPYIFRIDQESHGIVIEGTRWKITSGTPAKVSVVPGAEATVDYILIDDEAQNATDGISDGSQTKRVDQTFNQLQELRPRFSSNPLWQTRITGAENTPYFVQRANGRQEVTRNGDSANGTQFLEINASGQWHSNARFNTDLGYVTANSDFSSRPFQAGTQYMWWDTFGKTRTKSGSVPSSAIDGFPLGQKVTVPASSTGAGAPGDWAAATGFLYIYLGDGTTHTWQRATLTAF
jgi:hypothetical protein